jgi:dTDP-4-amino-4,6-dideoxygalactose transaminase
MTFAATANAITYTGATPVFIDSDPSGNVDVELLDRALQELKAAGERVSAIVPVDLLGKCADYTSIDAIAQRHDVRVLADAAESFGAMHDDKASGSFGDAAVFSFNGNKIMTTSGGGMLLTDDQSLSEHVRFLSTQAREQADHYEHKEVGYNYRLSNVLAALGRAQLTRLDEMIERRRAHREAYANLFAEVPGVSIFGRDGDFADNCWLTAILVDRAEAGWSAAELSKVLLQNDIESRPLWKPMHLQPVYADRPSYLNGYSQAMFETGLTLPSGSNLSTSEVGRIHDAVRSAIGSLA